MNQRWKLVAEMMRRDMRSWRSWFSTALFFAALFAPKPYNMLILAVTMVMVVLESRDEFRRRRPRQRMRDGGTVLGVLTLVFICVPVAIRQIDPGTGPWEILYPGLMLACVTGTLSVVFLWRWRRLRAEAEVRLWQLRRMRAKQQINSRL